MSSAAVDITKHATAATPRRSRTSVVDERMLPVVRVKANTKNPLDANVLQRFVRSSNAEASEPQIRRSTRPILIRWQSYIGRLSPCLIYPRILEGSDTYCSRIM